jgi:hypothetical protein
MQRVTNKSAGKQCLPIVQKFENVSQHMKWVEAMVALAEVIEDVDKNAVK